MPTMTYPSTASEQTYIEVTGGVDTHKDTHTAAALDASGRLLGHREFAATGAGYAALLAWLGTLGQLVRVGVEGSGVYGAGLARFLQAAGVELVEVDARTVRPAAGRVSPTRSTPRLPRGLPRPAGPAVSRRPAVGRSTRCARCGWPAAPRWRPAPMPSARSRR